MKGFYHNLRTFSVLLIFIFSSHHHTFAQQKKHHQQITKKNEYRNVTTHFLWKLYNPISLDQKIFEEAVINIKIPNYIKVADVRLHLTNRARHKVKQEIIKNFSSKKSLERLVTLASIYLPTVKKIFSNNKCPDVLKYIMLLESQCVGNAKSDSRDPAIGYWQFKSRTAQWVG